MFEPHRRLAQAEVDDEQRHAVSLALEAVALDHAMGVMTEQLAIGMHHVGVGGHQVRLELAAIGQADAGGPIAFGEDALHRRVQAHFAAEVGKELQ